MYVYIYIYIYYSIINSAVRSNALTAEPRAIGLSPMPLSRVPSSRASTEPHWRPVLAATIPLPYATESGSGPRACMSWYVYRRGTKSKSWPRKCREGALSSCGSSQDRGREGERERER